MKSASVSASLAAEWHCKCEDVSSKGSKVKECGRQIFIREEGVTDQVDKYQSAEAKREASARLPSREAKRWRSLIGIRSGPRGAKVTRGSLAKLAAGCETHSRL